MINPAAVLQRHAEADVAALRAAVPSFDVRAGESALLRQRHAMLLLPRHRLTDPLPRRGIEACHGLPWHVLSMRSRDKAACEEADDRNHAHCRSPCCLSEITGKTLLHNYGAMVVTAISGSWRGTLPEFLLLAIN
jgi:hypothetical protein